MSVFARKDYPVKWVRVGDLSVVWAQSQRSFDERKAMSYAEAFDPDKFGVLTVTLPNGKGIYHVIDGQHRAAAVRQLWGPDEFVPCLVLSAKDPAAAADIWLGINGKRASPQAVDRFRVAVTAKHEAEMQVNKLIEGLGYKVGFDSNDGTLRAVSACMRVYRRFGLDALRDALLVIQGTWGKQADSVHGGIIQGYAEFLAEHGLAVDRKRLVAKMAKAYTPARLLGAARQAREMFRGTIPSNIVRVLVNTYNANLRNGRIGEDA